MAESLMTLTKLLAGAFALVLVAGMTSPVFAEPGNTTVQAKTVDLDFVITAQDPDLVTSMVYAGSFDALGVAVACANPAPSEQTIVTSSDNLPGTLTVTDCQDPGDVTVWEITISGATCIEGSCLQLDQQVAGELLPLDSTALLIGGLTSMSVWMIPSIAGIAGAVIYLIKFRTNKE